MCIRILTYSLSCEEIKVENKLQYCFSILWTSWITLLSSWIATLICQCLFKEIDVLIPPSWAAKEPEDKQHAVFRFVLGGRVDILCSPLLWKSLSDPCRGCARAVNYALLTTSLLQAKSLLVSLCLWDLYLFTPSNRLLNGKQRAEVTLLLTDPSLERRH